MSYLGRNLPRLLKITITGLLECTMIGDDKEIICLDMTRLHWIWMILVLSINQTCASLYVGLTLKLIKLKVKGFLQNLETSDSCNSNVCYVSWFKLETY